MNKIMLKFIGSSVEMKNFAECGSRNSKLASIFLGKKVMCFWRTLFRYWAGKGVNLKMILIGLKRL